MSFRQVDADEGIELDTGEKQTGSLFFNSSGIPAGEYSVRLESDDDTTDLLVLITNLSVETVDNFEVEPDGIYSSSETLSDYYSGNLGPYSITTNSPLEGSRSLETTAGDPAVITSQPEDGLNNYPSQGDTILFRYEGTDFGTADPPVDGIYFAVDSNVNEFYYLQLDGNANSIKFYKNGVSTVVASTSVTLQNIQYTVKVDWNDTNQSEIVCELYDDQDNLEASLTVQESELTNEGFGFRTFIFGPTNPTRRFDLIQAGDITFP